MRNALYPLHVGTTPASAANTCWPTWCRQQTVNYDSETYAAWADSFQRGFTQTTHAAPAVHHEHKPASKKSAQNAGVRGSTAVAAAAVGLIMMGLYISLLQLSGAP